MKTDSSLILRPGFSLLEILLAMSIIAIVFLTIFKMHKQTISINYAVKFYTIAPILAHNKIEKLELSSGYKSAYDSGEFGDNYPGYRYNVSINDADSEFLGDVAGDLKKIDVTVFTDIEEFSYNLRAYRFIQN
ncbi:MAG: prepilin-type N-terminal cleavage/methylation domain-containing protein [Deltaproteobacteria bacterium]|nr:prepilin-type N-terminal cleavage/methylation domain-containing protein [Deltaproteobacteria bacterium]